MSCANDLRVPFQNVVLEGIGGENARKNAGTQCAVKPHHDLASIRALMRFADGVGTEIVSLLT